MREELKEDRFEGGLTEEEKHWASTKSAIRKEFRLSDAYTKSLEAMDRDVSIDDYWGAIRWMESVGWRGSQRRAASSDRRVAGTIVVEMSDF